MGARRNELQREHDRRQVAELYLQLRPISEIARIVGLTRRTVYLDISAVQEQWKCEHPEEYAAGLVEALARIDLVEKEAWESWLASKGEHRKSKTRMVTGPKGQGNLAETVNEQRHGQTCYMDVIRWCCEQRAKILGLYAAQKTQGAFTHDHRVKVTVRTQWDEEVERLMGIMGAGETGSPLHADDILPPGFADS